MPAGVSDALETSKTGAPSGWGRRADWRNSGLTCPPKASSFIAVVFEIAKLGVQQIRLLANI